MKTLLNLRKSPILKAIDIKVPLWGLMIIQFLLGGGEQLNLLEIATEKEADLLEENAIQGFLKTRPGQSIVGTFVPMIGGDRFIPPRERALKWFSLAGVVGSYNIKARIEQRETPILILSCYDVWDFNGNGNGNGEVKDCSIATLPILIPFPLKIPFTLYGCGWTIKEEGVYLSEALLTKLNSRRFKTCWEFELEEWELGFPFDRIKLKGGGSYVEFK